MSRSLLKQLIRSTINEGRRPRHPVRLRNDKLVEYGSADHIESAENDLNTLSEMKSRYPRNSGERRDLQRAREAIRSHLRSAKRVYNRKSTDVIQEEPIIHPEDFTFSS